MSTDRREDSLYKHKYRELVKAVEDIKTDIKLLHHHPKLDFIKNDEVVEMVLDIIDKHIGKEQE